MGKLGSGNSKYSIEVNLSVANFSILYSLKAQLNQRFSRSAKWDHFPAVDVNIIVS